jgi:hypothetical protein
MRRYSDAVTDVGRNEMESPGSRTDLDLTVREQQAGAVADRRIFGFELIPKRQVG